MENITAESLRKELFIIGVENDGVTQAEIDGFLTSELFTPEDVGSIIELLGDMGIEIIETNNNNDINVLDDANEEQNSDYEKTEDLVSVYMRSLGKIELLTKEEEVELAKGLQEARIVVRKKIIFLPLAQKNERKNLEAKRQGKKGTEEEERLDRTNTAIEETLNTLRGAIKVIKSLNRELSCYGGSLDSLRILIEAEKRKNGNRNEEALISMEELCERAQHVFKNIEGEVGIDHEQLLSLWEDVYKTKDKMLKIKNELITRNLRLVINRAKKKAGKGLPLLDLIQEGNIGLIKAVNKFQHKKGFKFSTYATRCIDSTMARALMDHSRTIRLAVPQIEFYQKVAETERTLLFKLGKEPSREEIAKELSIPVEKVDDIFKHIQTQISIHTPVGDEEDASELIDFIGDKKIISPYKYAEGAEIKIQVIKVIKELSEIKEKILKKIFWEDYTLREAGKDKSISLSCNQVNVHKKRALEFLKKGEVGKKLKELL